MIIYWMTCKTCGADFRSDEEHHCAAKAKQSRKPTTRPVTPTETSSKASEPGERIKPPPKPVTTPRPRNYAPSHVITESERVMAWRAKNREHYNAYMRARRARKKAQE